MLSLVEFLNHVLPAEGYKCAVSINQGKVFQSFADSFENLEALLRGFDNTKHNAFFACATYKENTSRKRENINLVKSFWLDIDAGPNKPYADADVALDAADTFLAKTNLPTPTVVYSGNGVHLWWVLQTPITYDAWHSTAQNLKKLTQLHGLEADPARTADGASILRPPQTFNWKNQDQPKEVSCDYIEPTIENESFIQAIAQAGIPAGLRTEYYLPKVPSGFNAEKDSLPHAALDQSKFGLGTPKHYEPARGDLVSRHCKQLGKMRDTLGVLPEPVWYACLGLLAHCMDGEQLAQHWSSGHSDYSVEATTKKLTHAREAAGPTTCVRFQEINAEGCKGCPHNVTSPILLGHEGVVTPPIIDIPQKDRPYLPTGYQWGKNMELEFKKSPEEDEKDQETKIMVLSKHPVYLAGVRRDVTSGIDMLQFRHRSPHTDWATFTMPHKDFKGMGWEGALAHYGVNLTGVGARLFPAYFKTAYTGLLDMDKPTQAFSNCGWKNDFQDFLVGTTLYCRDGKIRNVGGSPDVEARAQYLKPNKKGNLKRWQELASKLFAPDCEGQAFGLLTSFATPLAPFAFNADEGGAILSLVCPTGGSGKTTTLNAVSSVWGNIKGLRLNANDTENSKSKNWATLCHLPPIYDEFHESDPKILANAVRRFTVGEDRKRLDKNGAMVLNESGWQTFMTSASNTSLTSVLQSATGDPQADRIFEIELPKPKDGAFSLTSELSREFQENAGFAGPAFMTLLVQPKIQDWVKTRVKHNIQRFSTVDGQNLSTKFRYVVRMIACVEAAGTIITRFGLLECDVPRIVSWALKQLTERVNDNYQGFTPEMALDSYISANLRNLLIVDGPFNPKNPNIVHNMPFEIRGRYEVNTRKLFLSSDQLRKHFAQHRCNYLTICRTLEEKGLLINRNRPSHLTAGTNLPSMRTTCWELDMTAPVASGMIKLINNTPVDNHAKEG